MAAPRWSPAPKAWEEADGAARSGAERRGEVSHCERRGETNRWWDEAKRDQAKRSEERRDEAKAPWRTCTVRARCARTYPLRSAPLCSARLYEPTRVCPCASCACDDGALARSRALTHASVLRARQSRSTRAKGIDGAAAKPPEPLFHRCHIERIRCSTTDEDAGCRPRAHMHTNVRSFRKRERERGEEGTSGTNERRESKRVRTMYTRYGSMTYYE